MTHQSTQSHKQCFSPFLAPLFSQKHSCMAPAEELEGETGSNKCIHFLPRAHGLTALFLGLLVMNRCRRCLIPSLSFLREEAKFVWDGDSIFGLGGHLETVGLLFNTLLAINELSLLNEKGRSGSLLRLQWDLHQFLGS